MIWNTHSEIPEGSHAFLSASKYSWLNYNEEKLRKTYLNHLATVKGTELHAFASQCIKLGQKLEDVEKTINMFVNDSIDLKLRSEQVLKYSEFCYGTADAIGLNEDLMILYVSDLKTGTHKASMAQLEIYAALFCLEYSYTFKDIHVIELRLYQNDRKQIYIPKKDRIDSVMTKIIEADKILQNVS